MSFVNRDDAQGHHDAIADTGEGYVAMGRKYVIRCMWCDEHFVGATRRVALGLYRQHERELQSKVGPPPVASADKSAAQLLDEFPD